MGITIQDAADFAQRMAALGPFEKSPHMAVAVSGGADSMALALLADRWARDLGGRITALTVDHALRQGSADEALQVGRWLDARGIDHNILTWRGDKPDGGVQAAARQARYGLMAATCREAGILHLLCAHHLEDQAETFLLRLGRASGIDGLAAMSPVLERDGIRLLRPLLQMPKDRLRGILKSVGQDWVEDPSNENPAFARIRIRKSMPELAAAGVSAANLAGTAAHMAHARVALEATASALLGCCAFVHPSGYIEFDGQALFAAPEEISLRALSRALMCVGGGIYPSAQQKLEVLHEKMKTHQGQAGGWKGATLGRCNIAPGPANLFRIIREMRNLPAPRALPVSGNLYWDRRFDVHFQAPRRERDNAKNTWNYKGLSIAPLGRQGLLDICSDHAVLRTGSVPKPVLWTLPAVFDDQGVVQVPHLNFTRPAWQNGSVGVDRAAFFPQQSLSGAGFAIAE